MGIDLLAVLLLQAKDHLNWREVGGLVALGSNQLLVGRDRQLGSVFELGLSVTGPFRVEKRGQSSIASLIWALRKTYNMRHSLAAVNGSLHDAVLVNPDCGQHIECVLVTRVNTVENQAAHNLLPGRPTLVPKLRFLQLDDVANVLHHAVEGSCRENLVLIVVGDCNQQLGVSVVHRRAQIVAVSKGKFIGVTGCRRV